MTRKTEDTLTLAERPTKHVTANRTAKLHAYRRRTGPGLDDVVVVPARLIPVYTSTSPVGEGEQVETARGEVLTRRGEHLWARDTIAGYFEE